MLTVILQDGKSFPRPAVLTQFVAYHYSLLSSSATAICAYEATQKAAMGQTYSGCTVIDLSQLQQVAKFFSSGVTTMHSSFWASIGANKLMPMIQFYVDAHANQKYDGAKAIRDGIQAELDSFLFQKDLNSYFGVLSFAITIYEDITGSDKHYMWAQGYKYRYNGYNIMYTFAG